MIENQIGIQDIRGRSSVFRRQTFITNHFAQFAEIFTIVGEDLRKKAITIYETKLCRIYLPSP